MKHLFGFVLLVALWMPSSSFAAAPDCVSLCPTAVECTVECTNEFMGLDTCDGFCTRHLCDACPATVCPDDCASVCAQSASGCATTCTFFDGINCDLTNCGDFANILGGFHPAGCTSQNNLIPIGGPYACCSGSDKCTCQDYEEVTYTCLQPTNNCVGEVGILVTDQTGCTACNDGNPCTTDACTAGVCDHSGETGYSQACYTGPIGTKDIGMCVGGIETCSGGAFGPCIGEVTPIVEFCANMTDDDCDGSINEDCGCPIVGQTQPCYGGPLGTEGVGVCTSGISTCRDDIPCPFPEPQCWSECVGSVTPTPEKSPVPPVVCDNLDNDCDGIVDQFIATCYTGPVGTDGVGECIKGYHSCTAGAWSACSDVTPSAEICGDGKDNDCDGVIDNGCPSACDPFETCNGLDDDCNGLVDDNVLLAMGTVCAAGSIFPSCDVDPCAVGEVCMAPTYFCSEDPTGCLNTNCPAPLVCYQGSCFEGSCSGHAMCDPANELCYNNGLCLSSTDPCAGLNCPVGQFCYKGGCYDPCNDSTDCTNPLLCYDGRCAPDACTDPSGLTVACPFDEICYGGNCFDPCAIDDECGPNNFCPAGRCAETNCSNVQCPAGEVCFGGACLPGCSLADCAAPDTCWDSYFCAPDDADLCAIAQCGQKPCFGGVCFDYCASDSECAAGERCWENRCVDLIDGKCDGIPCPAGESCFNGACFPTCDGTEDCTDVNSFCYQEVCVTSTCTPGQCDAGEVCHNGVCFLGCGTGNTCPDPLVCFDGDGPARCAPSACEAMDDTLIADYNSDHPFREEEHRLRSYQTNTATLYPRPFQPSGNAIDWTQITGTYSASPIHRANAAQVSIVYDQTTSPTSYAIYLSHGSLDPGQPAADAVYSIHVKSSQPGVLITDDENVEAFEIATDSGSRHIQAFISTNISETGGMLIGPFTADDDWSVEIYAAFHGSGIRTWQMVNGEDNTRHRLDPYYPLIISSEPFSDSKYLDPSIGTPCTAKNAHGICQRGMWADCRNFRRVCQQTIFGLGGDLCNGEDDDCDGEIDEYSSLVVPSVEYAIGWSGYQEWVSYDTVTPLARPTHHNNENHVLNYTALGTDNRLGSTDAVVPFDGALQENANQSHVFVHRNLKTGELTFPFVHGKVEPVVGWTPRVFDFEYRPFSHIRDLAIRWYEDRKPAMTGDRVYDQYNLFFPTEVQTRLEVVARSGSAETDVQVLGLRPLTQLNPATADPDERGFRAEFDYAGTSPYDWLLRKPDSRVSLPQDRRLRGRIVPRSIKDTICRSNLPTATCNLGQYVCVAGELRCSPANDNICSGCRDDDNDTFPGYDPDTCPDGTDCDDDDNSIFPGAVEVCDGKDNNCNGYIDQNTTGCPGGSTLCGPAECRFLNVCVCNDEDECACGEGLAQ